MNAMPSWTSPPQSSTSSLPGLFHSAHSTGGINGSLDSGAAPGPGPGLNGLSNDAASRLAHYYSFDQDRQAFVHQLMQELEASAERIKVLELDLEDQKRSRTYHQSNYMKLEKEMQHIKDKISMDSFAVVLVDGDGAKFADEYLQDPVSGAEQAAGNLQFRVREHLRNASVYGWDEMPVMVRVYANLNDLSKALRYSNVIESDENMRVFAESLTNGRFSLDFVNVGKGKENADSKMRNLLEHFHRNVQCKQIFVAGCCSDNGYLHDLRNYKGTDKITLVETTAAEPGFASLGFPTLRWDDVFRSEPLNNEFKRRTSSRPGMTMFGQTFPQRVSESDTLPTRSATNANTRPPGLPSPTLSRAITVPVQPEHARGGKESPDEVKVQSPIAPPPPKSKSPGESSNVVSSGNGGHSISYATAGGSSDHQNVTIKTSKSKKQPKVIYYNDDNYRIDTPISHPPKTAAQSTYQNKFTNIRPSVFCNDHYLKGRCKWGSKCDKTHDIELTLPELAIHRYKARTSLCPSGPYCVEYDCYLSHHCPRDNCTRGDCPFLDSKRWGDLHLTKAQLQPASKWIEGVDNPEYLN